MKDTSYYTTDYHADDYRNVRVHYADIICNVLKIIKERNERNERNEKDGKNRTQWMVKSIVKVLLQDNGSRIHLASYDKVCILDIISDLL